MNEAIRAALLANGVTEEQLRVAEVSSIVEVIEYPAAQAKDFSPPVETKEASQQGIAPTGRGQGTIPRDVEQILSVLKALGRKVKSSEYRNKLAEMTNEPRKLNATNVLIAAAIKHPNLIGWEEGNPNLFWAK